MEEAGIIKGSSLNLDYVKLGYSFIAYIGIFLEKTKVINDVIESLNNIPFVTVAHITTGKFNIFCKVRAHDTKHAKDIIFMIDDIDGVSRTETMISLEESINEDYGVSSGFHFGLNYAQNFSDVFSVRLEVLYVQNGAKKKFWRRRYRVIL